MSGLVATFLGLGAIGALAFYAGSRHRTFRDCDCTSKDDLRTLLEAADETVLLLGPDGSVQQINDTGTRRFGLTREQMVGQNLFALLPAEIAGTMHQRLLTMRDTRRPLAGEDWRNGRCLAWRAHPMVQDDETIKCIWVFAKDVTGKRQMQALEAVFHQFDQRLLRHRVNTRGLAQHLCQELMPLYPLQAVWIAQQTTHGRLTFLAGAGDDVERVAEQALAATASLAADDIIHQVMHRAEPRVVRADAPEWELLPAALRPDGCNIAAAVPIYVADTVFGVLALHGRADDEATVLALFDNISTIANHASIAFEAAYDQSRLRLYEQALASTDSAVFITDGEGHIAWANEAFLRVSGYGRREIVGRTPALFRSGRHDDSYFRDMWETLQDGRVWRSEIINCRKDGSHYVAQQIISPVPGDDGKTSHYVTLLEDVTDKKAMEERLAHLASHDILTDLPNRLLFEQNLPRQLALTRRNRHRCAVLFVDLDAFKPINDTYGHLMGDQVLKQMARRLHDAVRLSDGIARFGGDEFVVVLPDISETGDAAKVAEKLLAACQEPVLLDGLKLQLGASIGIAIFPDHTEEADVLVKFADEAMYLAKMEGRNTYRFHGS